MATMKAVRIHGYGGPEVLHFEEVPRPRPGAGEILVKVYASGVNPADWKLREGYMREMIPLKLPIVLGLDFSGVVESMGPGVDSFHRGDAVFGRAEITHQVSHCHDIFRGCVAANRIANFGR